MVLVLSCPPMQSGATREEVNLYTTVSHQFDKAAATLRYPEYLLRQIKACNNIYEFHFPVRVGKRPFAPSPPPAWKFRRSGT